MLYFAYGSNMDWTRMRDRCRDAQFLFKAMLPDHELQFTRTSSKFKCGTADILPVGGRIVWGVVYHLEEKDRTKLDKKEGVGSGAYRPIDVTVHAEGATDRKLEVFTYIVCSKEMPRPKPSRTYLQHLLDGSDKWQLPDDYRNRIQEVETLPPSEGEIAEALARDVASRVIQNNRELWDTLKYHLADCQNVDTYGSVDHMDFLSVVRCEVDKLSDPERALLEKHLVPSPGAPKSITYCDLINGQILIRAKNAARRM